MLATIIVNYKSEERTIKYVIEELIKCALQQVVVIVNNGATRESSQQLANALQGIIVSTNLITSDTFSKYYIIHNEANSGFAIANNLGFDFAVKYFDIDYVLFTNNDIVFIDENVIELLIEKYKTLDHIGMIGPKIVGSTGDLQSPYLFTPFWEEMVMLRIRRMFRLKKSIYTLDREKTKEGFYYRLMGSFFLMDVNSFSYCGKMDSNTFLYGEEVILSERLNAINKKCFYYPNVSVLHEHGQTIRTYLQNNQSSKHLLDSMFYYFCTFYNVNRLEIICAKIINIVLNFLSYVKVVFNTKVDNK
jgi:GT2 family glycosyltransferase